MASNLKRFGVILFIVIIVLSGFRFIPSQASPAACDYWVDPTGSDGNPGSSGSPWATLQHAYNTAVDNSCTVWFNPGTYDANSLLQNPGGSGNRFSTTTTFKSVVPYKAILQNAGKVLDLQGVQNMVFEGFEIKQTKPAPVTKEVMIDFHRQSVLPGPAVFLMHVTFRNNIIHDANGDDIALIKGGVQFVTFENNIFYNQAGEQQMLDINSAQDVTVQDNIFFNDFTNPVSITRSYIEVTDTNGNLDGYEGSERITIRRNVFLNWQGIDSFRFIQAGVGNYTYHTAKDVTVENNLMIGNSIQNIGEAFGVTGARDVSFVNNTVVGDLPASSYAMQIDKQPNNPNNLNIYFYNNIWSDPTGTMGACYGCGGDDFSDGDPLSTTNLVLDNNFYYNGGDAIPGGDVLSPLIHDANRVVADPGLNTNQSGIVLPRWNGTSFLSGNTTVRDEFVRLVNNYGAISSSSPASGVANPGYAPSEDILGTSRPSSPSMGAYEPLGFNASIQLTKTSNVNQAQVGEDIQYTVQITNTSPSGSPTLNIDSITDSLQGDLTNPSNYDTNTCGPNYKLSQGSSCSITYTYTVKQADPDPLVNIATVQSHPQGYSFPVSDNDSKSVDLIGSGVTLEIYLPLIQR